MTLINSIFLKTKTFKVISSGLFITIVSVGFIWCYLWELGREDLFLEIVSYRSLFSFTAFMAIAGVFLFSICFFLPSVHAVLIIKKYIKPGDKHKETPDKSNLKYMITLYISSLISFMSLLVISYFHILQSNSLQTFWLAFCGCTLCILINLPWGLKRSGTEIKEYFNSKKKHRIFMFFFKLIALGFVSGFFIFPLIMLIKNLDFPANSSDLEKHVDLLCIGLIVIIFTYIPAIIFLSLPENQNIIKKILAVIKNCILVLILLSLPLPVIPAMIINATVHLAGLNNLTPTFNNFISVHDRPAENFSDPRWKLHKSPDNKFYLFNSITLFKFGDLVILCPPEVVETYKKTLHYEFLSSSYDKELRDNFLKDTHSCILFRKNELSF